MLFERVRGANRNVSPGEGADALRSGLRGIDPALTAAVGGLVPGGNYRVSLPKFTPPLVTPGAELDYFAHEQVALWGIDAF